MTRARTISNSLPNEQQHIASARMLQALEGYAQLAGERKIRGMESIVCPAQDGRVTLYGKMYVRGRS